MERKLELRDIASYLPYGLKYITKNKYQIIEGDKKIEIVTFDNIKHIYLYAGAFDIILRPLSDLYKTIVHNGKEIVPIVELAKIAFPKYDWLLEKIQDSYHAVSGSIWFTFFNGSFYIDGIIGNPIDNQYQLFDYMNELKIDYRGLIDAGLAVSVYDIENPYK